MPISISLRISLLGNEEYKSSPFIAVNCRSFIKYFTSISNEIFFFFSSSKKKKTRKKIVFQIERVNRSATISLLILNNASSIVFFPYHIGCRTHFFQSPPIRRLIPCHKKVLAHYRPMQAEMITRLQSDSHKSAENRLPFSPLTPTKRSSRTRIRASFYASSFLNFFSFIAKLTPLTHTA